MLELLEKQEVISRQDSWSRADLLFPHLDQQAARIADSIGAVALSGEVSVDAVDETETANETTLLSAIQLAALGDEESRKLVEENVRTDYAERLFKSKHQTEVKFELVDGYLSQNGRRNINVFENTLKHSELNEKMLNRTRTEYKNAVLFDLLANSGLLERSYALVASPTPTDEYTRRKFNFFEDTDTMSLQLLGGEGDEFTLETAFVAGKTTKNGQRHDIEAILKIAESKNIDIEIASVEDLLSYVVIIPKEELPNGVASIVEQYDDVLGGTFYGEDEERQNYSEYARTCKKRNFAQATNRITDKLIAEAAKFKTPIDANKRLDELSGSEAVNLAVIDSRINPRIFGALAAPLIEQARVAEMYGHTEIAMDLTQQAQKVETSGSCPFSGSKNESLFGGEGASSSEVAEDKFGSLTFKCKKGHENTRPRNKLIDKCTTCGDSVKC